MAVDSSDAVHGRRYAKWIEAICDALGRSDVAGAEQYLGVLAETYPDDAEYLRLRAIAQDARGRVREAITTMRHALALRPDDAPSYNTLACLYDHAYEYDAAIKSSQCAVRLDPGFFTGWYNLSIVLAHAGRHQDAAEALKRAHEIEPDNVAVRAKLAEALRDQGLAVGAEAAYREILRERPWMGSAWLGLADIKTARLGPNDVMAMRSALASTQASPDDRAAINYGLARALEDQGDYAGSLRALALAKSYLRERQPWDAANFSNEVSAVLGAFDPPPAGSAARELGREVIFIVGMPRSGTTLVEQILASHPDVMGGGELTDLSGVLAEESSRRGSRFPHWAQAMERADWERLGRRYLERTVGARRQHSVSTDKLPSNWVFVGAALAMLPSARVVCCRRDPLETCFSNYRQYRARLEYTGSYSDVAAFWADFDKATRAWCRNYPNNVFEHAYEELLADPEQSIRKLLRNCGLSWDPHCLEFWNTRREVHTPSAMQVRTPLYSSASRSKRYGTLLDPLRKCLHRG